MSKEHPTTEELLGRARAGDRMAVELLLGGHRERLSRMVAIRLDPRMAARVDPSDVVQEALAEAARKLPKYLNERPLPFYPWLRQLAWEQLVDLQRHHLRTKKRSVLREGAQPLADRSAAELVRRLVASGTSPSERLIRGELKERVRKALDQLSSRDREVLVLRYLEQLSTSEVAVVLGMSERTVQSRHRQALESLQEELGE